MRLPLFALATGAFAIGTTEFVIMGLLPGVAADLHVTVPRAGLLVSGYAMGVVVGGPLVALAMARVPRKRTLLVLMACFIAGNALCALASSYSALMAARVVSSLCHGSFFGTGAVVATHIVSERERSRAIALLFAGLTVANIVGVPLGTLLGQAFGWRMTFWAVVALGALAFAAILRYVPALEGLPMPRLGREIRALCRPQVLLALAMTVFGFGGVFTVFTYIAPLLAQQAGLSGRALGPVLVLFGIGSTVGTLVGGRLADRALMPALSALLATLLAFFVIFAWSMNVTPLAVVSVFALGLVGFAAGPGLQARSLQQAGDAPLLASTLNQSAFNLGNAGGAFLGARLLEGGHGYPVLSLAAAAVACVGLLLTLVSAALDRREGTRPQAYV